MKVLQFIIYVIVGLRASYGADITQYDDTAAKKVAQALKAKAKDVYVNTPEKGDTVEVILKKLGVDPLRLIYVDSYNNNGLLELRWKFSESFRLSFFMRNGRNDKILFESPMKLKVMYCEFKRVSDKYIRIENARQLKKLNRTNMPGM